ncbi:MAG: hypothetical protein K1X71_20630 [Pirellulales bacterium]|nr:hypothetical protein [Pirellulales bacterium]
MKHRESRPTWPFLILLAGLFVLSLMAPRGWERIARRHEEPLPARPAPEREVPEASDDYAMTQVVEPTPAQQEPYAASALVSSDNLPLAGPATGEYDAYYATNEIVHESSETPEPAGSNWANQAAWTIEPESPQSSEPPTAQPPASDDEATAASVESLAPLVQSPAASAEPTQFFTDPPSPAAATNLSEQLPQLEDNWSLDPNAGDLVADEGPQPTLADPPASAPIASGPVLPDNELDAVRVALRPGEQAAAPQDRPEDFEAAPVAETPAAEETTAWKAPAELRDDLTAIHEAAFAQDWAADVLHGLDELESLGGPRTPQAQPVISRLRSACNTVEKLALRMDDAATAERLRRVGYAVQRRCLIWEQVAALPQAQDALALTEPPEPERLLACLSRVDALTHASPNGDGWRKFLLLDGLHELAEHRQAAADRRRQIARDALERLSTRGLSSKQRRFMTAHPLLSLRSELKYWAAETVDVDELMRELEAYEVAGKASTGELVTASWHQLRRAKLPAAQRLARDIDSAYRGANVRIVITDTLLTRMMPGQPSRDEFVREEILGLATRGHTHTTTKLAVQLVPDPGRLRFRLQASGLVHARTSAKPAGATVWAGMNSTYQIEKPFEFTMAGLQSDWTEADAQTRTHLRGVETPLTGVPILGSMVEGFIRQQYNERRREAEQELRRKIISKAVREMELQVDQRIAESNQQLRERVLIPLERLRLEPTVAEMQTTAERLTLRLRLAGDHQLAANTPRPRAPSDALASIQIHESVLNNVFNQLDLNGRTFSQAELFGWITERLNRPLEQAPDNLRNDVFLTFAPNDSFLVRVRDGGVEINLHLDELRAEGDTYRDFTVRVYYRPDETSPTGDLVRDGVVQLIGNRITLRGQIALRGIFSKTFPREKRFSLLPKRFQENKELQSIRVTQIELNDGWLAIALAEPRVAHAATGAKTR